jgi:hypothetical protein
MCVLLTCIVQHRFKVVEQSVVKLPAAVAHAGLHSGNSKASRGSAARDVKRAEQVKSNCPLVWCERGKS